MQINKVLNNNNSNQNSTYRDQGNKQYMPNNPVVSFKGLKNDPYISHNDLKHLETYLRYGAVAFLIWV